MVLTEKEEQKIRLIVKERDALYEALIASYRKGDGITWREANIKVDNLLEKT